MTAVVDTAAAAPVAPVAPLVSIPEYEALEIFSPIFKHPQTSLTNWPSDCTIIEPLLRHNGYTTAMLDGPDAYIDTGIVPPLMCRSHTLALLGHCADCNKLNYCTANDNFPDQLDSIRHSRAAKACPVCSPGKHDEGQFFYVYYEGGSERTEIEIPRIRHSTNKRSASPSLNEDAPAPAKRLRPASPPLKDCSSEDVPRRSTTPATPPLDTDTDLDQQAQSSIDAFITSGGETPYYL